MNAVNLNNEFADSVMKLTEMYDDPDLDNELDTMTKCFRALYTAYIRQKKTLDTKENDTKALIKANAALADHIEQELKTLK